MILNGFGHRRTANAPPPDIVLDGAAGAEQLQDARESGRIMDGGRVREAEIIHLKAQTPVVSAAPGERQTAPTTQAQRFDLGATR